MLMGDYAKKLISNGTRKAITERLASCFITKSGRILQADECGPKGLIVKLNSKQ